MKKYQVLFVPTAEDEILDAYEWGVEFWGEDRAKNWLRELYSVVLDRLSRYPESSAVAPESSRLRREVRHLVFGRYRIIYEIQKKHVIVLHLTGPFKAAEPITDDN